MKVPLNAISVILIVTLTAIFGMLMGAAFGWAAGRIAPDFFTHLVAWKQLEPEGVALIMGAFGGVLCGGLLGTFAVVVQVVAAWKDRTKSQST